MVSMLCFMLYQQMQHSRQAYYLEYTANHVLGNCTAQVIQFDGDIKRFESLLQNAAALVMLRLQSDEPLQEYPFYPIEILNDRETYPASLVKSSIYQHYVDFQAMSYLKPMTDLKSREHGLKIASIMPELRKLLLKSSTPEKNLNPDYDILEQKAIHNGIPLLRFLIGFPDGQMYHYPAMTQIPENYAVKDRFWFHNGMSSKNNNPVWTSPYLDIWPENGPLLTCYMPLRRDQTPDGVIALDLSLRNVVRNILQSGGTPYLLEQILLNSRGQVLVSTDPLHQPESLINRPEEVQIDNFYHDEMLLDRILSMKTGIIRSTEADKSIAYVFHQLQSLDWIYLEKIDLEQ